MSITGHGIDRSDVAHEGTSRNDRALLCVHKYLLLQRSGGSRRNTIQHLVRRKDTYVQVQHASSGERKASKKKKRRSRSVYIPLPAKDLQRRQPIPWKGVLVNQDGPYTPSEAAHYVHDRREMGKSPAEDSRTAPK